MITMLKIIFISSLLFFFSCGKEKYQNETSIENIIAIVGEDTLFVNDYIKRSEFSIRPPYCDDNKIYDKGIILNSLLAEYLITLEAGEINALSQNPIYKAKMQGIKEQLMREKLIYEEVVKNVHIPQNEINQAYSNSKKKVHTEAVFIPDNYDPDKLYKMAMNGLSFDEMSIKYFGVSKKITNTIQWGKIDKEAQNVIFSDKVKKGTLLRPLKTDNGYRLIRVTGWSEEIEISPGNTNQQKEIIKTSLEDYAIQTGYQDFAKQIMKGKRIDFQEVGWDVVYNALLSVYVEEELENKLEMKELSNLLNEKIHTPFMKVDNTIWSIDTFIKAVQIHPLEISEKNINKDNFKNILKSAVAGLITDTYLTNLGYKKGFDKDHGIKRDVKKWKRYFISNYARDIYLNNKGYKNQLTIDYDNAFQEFLNPWIDSLKTKYNAHIVYNPKALEKIDLTNTPLLSYKTKGPYKGVVPAFPLITNSHITNYKRIEYEQQNKIN